MAKRTRIEFTHPGDLWSIVDPWAVANGYRVVQPGGSARLYQKGYGVLVAPMMLSVQMTGERAAIEAWVRMNLLARAGALFLLPAEMSVESGGFRAVLPRRTARTTVNKLLASLGLPAIP
jgi:hypothetical protein